MFYIFGNLGEIGLLLILPPGHTARYVDFSRIQTQIVGVEGIHFDRITTGLVVMGRDSCSEGRGFKSQLSIGTGWTFFTLNLCNICNVGLKKTKNKWKEAVNGPFKKKHYFTFKNVLFRFQETGTLWNGKCFTATLGPETRNLYTLLFMFTEESSKNGGISLFVHPPSYEIMLFVQALEGCHTLFL